MKIVRDAGPAGVLIADLEVVNQDVQTVMTMRIRLIVPSREVVRAILRGGLKREAQSLRFGADVEFGRRARKILSRRSSAASGSPMIRARSLSNCSPTIFRRAPLVGWRSGGRRATPRRGTPFRQSENGDPAWRKRCTS